MSGGIRVVKVSEVTVEKPKVKLVHVIPPLLMTYITEDNIEKMVSERESYLEIKTRILKEIITNQTNEEILRKLLKEIQSRIDFIQKLINVKMKEAYVNPIDILEGVNRIRENINLINKICSQDRVEEKYADMLNEVTNAISNNINRLIEGRKILNEVLENMKNLKKQLELEIAETESKYKVGLATADEYSIKKEQLSNKLEKTNSDIEILDYYEKMTHFVSSRVHEIEWKLKEIKESENVLEARYHVGEIAETIYKDEKQKLENKMKELNSELDLARTQVLNESNEIKNLIEKLLKSELISSEFASCLLNEVSAS